MAEEKVFFNGGGVKVTNTRIIVDGDTYTLANVTSCKSRYKVETGLDTSNAKKRKLIKIIGWLAIILSLFIGFKANEIIGSIITAAIMYLAMIILNAIFKDKPFNYRVYTVSFGSASGEKDAITSHNENFINKVVNAVNDAIVSRG